MGRKRPLSKKGWHGEATVRPHRMCVPQMSQETRKRMEEPNPGQGRGGRWLHYMRVCSLETSVSHRTPLNTRKETAAAISEHW